MPGWEILGEEERRAVNEVFDSGGVLFRHGFAAQRNNIYKVREFEAAFALYMGVPFAHAVTSGSAALKVALKALGVGPGDEVITQCHTFVATVEAILECGATPVITEIDRTLNMDPDDLAQRITTRTRAIIVVHMLGAAGHLKTILELARKHHLPVVEDTAQACGASYHGRRLGTFGDCATFSFDHGKVLTTGEGGMVITSSPELSFRARCYTDHGHEDNPSVPRGEDTRSFPGFNYRMMELQGAVGLEQLKKLPASVACHRANQRRLRQAIEAIVPEQLCFRETPDPEGESGDALVFFLENAERARRVARALQAAGVGFKNLPDALKWHYAGTWDHMLANAPWRTGGQSLEDCFAKSGHILRSAIALPIFYRMDEARLVAVANSLKASLSEK